MVSLNHSFHLQKRQYKTEYRPWNDAFLSIYRYLPRPRPRQSTVGQCTFLFTPSVFLLSLLIIVYNALFAPKKIDIGPKSSPLFDLSLCRWRGNRLLHIMNYQPGPFSSPVLRKFQQKFSLMTPLCDVPNVSGKVVSFRFGHGVLWIILFLRVKTTI